MSIIPAGGRRGGERGGGRGEREKDRGRTRKWDEWLGADGVRG